MKLNFCALLTLSAIILTAGCKKASNSSVTLATGAKAGFVTNPDWQKPAVTGRIIRFDVHSGNGSDCLFAYDISSGQVSLTQVTGTSSSTLYSGIGIPTDNIGTVSVSQYGSDCTDQFNEVGGVHIIPYDADGIGYEDHLLLYIPLRRIVYLLKYNGGGVWHSRWSSTTGIGGYDLAGITDKIITYDYGFTQKRALICYRPGYGNFWVIENTNPGGSSATPVWVARVSASGGVGGFDLKGTMDQLVAIGGPNPGYMCLMGYRPSYGYVYVMSHGPNSTGWVTNCFQSRSGFYTGPNTAPAAPLFNLGSLQDRVVAVNGGAFEGSNADNHWIAYRPGNNSTSSGANYGVAYIPSGPSSLIGGSYLPYSLTWPMYYNPYGGYPGGGVGDHILPFSPIINQGNSSLLFYVNGNVSQSQIYEWNSSTGTYTEVY